MNTEPPALINTSGQKLSTKKAPTRISKPAVDDMKKYEGDFLGTLPEIKVQKIIIHTVKNILERGDKWMKSLMRMNKAVLSFLQPHNKDHSFYQWVSYQMKNGKKIPVVDPEQHLKKQQKAAKKASKKAKEKKESKSQRKRARSPSLSKSKKRKKKKYKKKKREKKRRSSISSDGSEEISA